MVRDKSRNVAWLAIASFGESWHNLHHADPTCARHGALRGPDRPERAGDLGVREARLGIGRALAGRGAAGAKRPATATRILGSHDQAHDVKKAGRESR